MPNTELFRRLAHAMGYTEPELFESDDSLIASALHGLDIEQLQRDGFVPLPNSDEVLFSDGALYRGNMRNGKIEGPGEYQSAMGELMFGNFQNGILNGDNCYVKNLGGEKWKGTFVDGEINGLGKYENERGDTYDGVSEFDVLFYSHILNFPISLLLKKFLCL